MFLWIRRSDLPPEFREATTPKSDDAAAGPTTANTFRGDFQQLIDKLEALEIPEDEHGCKDIATVMKTIKADYGSDSLTVLTSKSLALKRDFGTPQSSRSSPAPTLKVHDSGSKVENEEPKAEPIEKNSEDLTYDELTLACSWMISGKCSTWMRPTGKSPRHLPISPSTSISTSTRFRPGKMRFR